MLNRFSALLRITLLPILPAIAGCMVSPPQAGPAAYALVYGLARYSDYTTLNDLTYTDDDAQAMADLFSARGYTEVILRLDAQATKAQLTTDIADLAARVEPEATVVFYFAGHGFGDGMEFMYAGLPDAWHAHFDGLSGADEPYGASPYTEYLFLYNAVPITENVQATLQNAVSDSELATLMMSIPARNRIVIIDACHSGGFTGDTTSVDTVPTNFFGQGGGIAAADALSSLRLYFGGSASEDTTDTITYLAAAGETEFSWESGTRRHGIFTYFLLEGLQSGDHDGDGYITVSEAYAHTEARVMSEWNAGRYYSSPEYRDRSPTFRPRLGTGAVDPVLVTSPE